MNLACQASLFFTIFHSLLKLMPLELVMPSKHLILYHPLLLLPSVFPSTRVFSQWVGSSHQVAKGLELQLQYSPSNEYSGLVSFRIEWFDLLAVQRMLKSLLQHQFKNISYLALSLLYGPRVTSVHDYWRKHSFNYIDLCWQSNVSGF